MHKLADGEGSTVVEVTSARGKPNGKREVVASIEIDQYDSLAEFCQALGGEEPVLALANLQFATNAKNEARRKATTTVSEKRLRDEAEAFVSQNRELRRAIDEAATSEADYLARVERAVQEKMAELRVKYGSTPPSAPSEETEG